EFLRPLPPERPGSKFSFDDLAKTQWHEHLMEGMLNQRTSIHLDVAVVNERQAVQRLESVLQNKGIKVLIDPVAAARLAKNQPKTEYVIFTENIRPDELAAMLYELGTDERARTSIETLTVSNVTEADQKQLCGLLGIDSRELETPPVAQPLPFGQFVPKGNQPGEKQPPASSGASPPEATPTARLAMVLVNEARSGATSSQLQFFLSQRRPSQPRALQVILVVHQA
ncbi:MAG: hypothetical protein NZO58_05425, partial [Gemmataceae bacterium]|nr:hypothetical protein [Gemmataceae bacterium]